jgi:hypothetical protein
VSAHAISFARQNHRGDSEKQVASDLQFTAAKMALIPLRRDFESVPEKCGAGILPLQRLRHRYFISSI